MFREHAIEVKFKENHHIREVHCSNVVYETWIVIHGFGVIYWNARNLCNGKGIRMSVNRITASNNGRFWIQISWQLNGGRERCVHILIRIDISGKNQRCNETERIMAVSVKSANLNLVGLNHSESPSLFIGELIKMKLCLQLFFLFQRII